MKLRVLMVFMIAPLISIAGYFAWLEYTRLKTTMMNAEQSSAAADELLYLSELIHELQKERGFSAGFVASSGQNFGRNVANQRVATDRVWSRIRPELSYLTQHHEPALQTLDQSLTGIQTLRDQISDMDITAPDLGAAYTAVINDLIALKTKVTTDLESGTLKGYARASVLISKAKESAGLERAMGATGLGQETFPQSVYVRFISLRAEQEKTMQLAQAEMGEDELVNTLRNSAQYVRLSDMRDMIAAARADNRRPELSAAEWFTGSSQWIDRLSVLERSLISQLRENSEGILAKARTAVRQKIWISSTITIFVLIMSVATFEYVIFRVKRLTKAMQRFTEGEFNIWIPGIESRDEVGQMAAAVYAFKQETLAMRKAAAEQKADDEAAIIGKAQKVVDLVTEGLAALATADLSRQFDAPLDPEYDKIRTDLNAATQRLRQVMLAVVQTAGDLDQSAQDLMQSASDLGQRTTEQVDTIASTNDRVSRLSEEVADFASNVRDASERASSAKTTADRSGVVVRSAVDAMDRIASSSNEIGRIISMIEDITFQTNLLALNAGVEAARAGESGRGFAVVASEVRELAKRSSVATQEIKTPIEESGRTVAEGVGLVGQAGDSLEDIFAQVTQIDEVLGQVAESSVTQATDLQDIAHEVTRLNDLASRNMDAVDASGQTSQETARMSKHMTHLIGDFTLAEDTRQSSEGNRAA